MLKVRVTRSISGYADFSMYELRADKITAAETARRIPEKWLFAFADDFEDLIRRYRHIAAHRAKSGNQLEKEFMKKGLVFSRLLFGTKEAAEILFSGSNSDPVVFSVDKEYSHLPFEVLANGTAFLCDVRPVLRSLRSETAETRNHSPWSKLRRPRLYVPIAATAKPDIMRSATEERHRLIQAVNSRLRVQAPDGIQLRLSTLLENMLTADFMHFAGHSSEFEIPLASGESLAPRDIVRLKLNNLDLVFLNSCQSAKQSNSEFQETFASAFIGAGVRNFIGYGLPVPNGAAEKVSLAFWKNIRDGDKPHVALFKARRALQFDTQFSAYRFLLQEFGDIELQPRRRTRLISVSILAALLTVGVSSFLFWRAFDKKVEKRVNVATVEKPKVAESRNNKRPRRKKQAKKNPTQTASQPDRKFRALIEDFAGVSMKHDFQPQDIALMNKIWEKMEIKADKSNFVCSANLMNGNKKSGSAPIGRRQIIRNLLVFRCVPEAPADWDDYVQRKLKRNKDS